MPLAASVVLSTVRRLRGLILAPDASSRSSTFFATPVTSRRFNGTTLSRPFTGCTSCKRDAEARTGSLTVKTPDNGLFVISLLYHDLNVRVAAGKRLKMIKKVGTCARGGGPFVAVLKNQLPELRDESDVAIGRPRAQLGAEERLDGRRHGAETESGHGQRSETEKWPSENGQPERTAAPERVFGAQTRNKRTWQERQDLPQTSKNQTPPPRPAIRQKNENAPAPPTTMTDRLQNCLEPTFRPTPTSPPPLTLIWMTLTPHPFSTSWKRTVALHLLFPRLYSHIRQCRFSGPARPRLPTSIPCANPGFLFTTRIAEATGATSTWGLTGISNSFSQPQCLRRLKRRVPSRTYSPFPCLTPVLARRTPQFYSIAFAKSRSRSLTKLLVIRFAFLLRQQPFSIQSLS